MSGREHLPFRRRSELREFRHNSQSYSLGVSFFPNSRRVAEIFLSSNKPGSKSASIARDGAILASLALQHGVDLGTLRHAVTRAADGTAATAVGAPSHIVEIARACMGGSDLDPASCAVANETVRASRFFDIKQDGLKQPWSSGRVWLNPPYGRFGPAFVWKAVEEFKSGRIGQAIILKAREDYEAPGAALDLLPIPDPATISVSAWIKRKIAPRDHLLGGVMCTTSRWFCYGKTGIGKTLFGMCMGGGMSPRARAS
jgi:DNA N-6-adenine-methyltransferase (Dam)